MSVASENKKLFSLSPEVIKKLEAEDNKSALVDALLANYYGIHLPDEKPYQKERHEILAKLDFESEDSTEKADTVNVEPLNEGKPLDSIQPPINVMGKPAVQEDDGTLLETCPNCGSPKRTSICLNCLV